MNFCFLRYCPRKYKKISEYTEILIESVKIYSNILFLEKTFFFSLLKMYTFTFMKFISIYCTPVIIIFLLYMLVLYICHNI